MSSHLRWRRLCAGLALICLVSWLAACGNPTPTAPLDSPPPPTGDQFESPLPTPLVLGPLTLEPGMGGVKGRIVASPQEWQGKAITVFFAAYYEGGEGQGGFFLLEPAQAPSTGVDASGAFQLGSIPPRKYVVVIGPDAEDALSIQDNDAPGVFEVVAGEILDLGEVSLP
jgi:hypothetical protein